MRHDAAGEGRRAAFGCLAVMTPLVVAAALLAVVVLWNVNGAG